ncbi:MAG: SUF system NifU family Fe-S cluster assembly protein [Lentisphaeria bacterium]|nr:SUF system NifU family Fe-S cluster assembly protein [Lentisphaeria bacterium]
MESDLYQQLIMNHYREPHNHGKLDPCTCHAFGKNPLCGDEVSVYCIVDQNILKTVQFEGAGCAISQAAASMMTEMVSQMQVDDLYDLYERIDQILKGELESGELSGELEHAYAAIAQFPMRTKCARLPWKTLVNALQGKTENISTEND